MINVDVAIVVRKVKALRKKASCRWPPYPACLQTERDEFHPRKNSWALRGKTGKTSGRGRLALASLFYAALLLGPLGWLAVSTRQFPRSMTAYDGAKKMGLVRSVLTMGLIAQVQWFLLDVARRSESPLSPYARGVLDDAMAPLIGVGQGDFFNATGRTILITGTRSGFGEALAYEYASHGATQKQTNKLRMTICLVIRPVRY